MKYKKYNKETIMHIPNELIKIGIKNIKWHSMTPPGWYFIIGGVFYLMTEFPEYELFRQKEKPKVKFESFLELPSFEYHPDQMGTKDEILEYLRDLVEIAKL